MDHHPALVRLTDSDSNMPHPKPATAAVTVVNVGYRSTNYWVVSAGTSRLLIDLGWPGMFGALRANLLRADIPLNEIRFGLARHYHIDHAGAAEDLKQVGVPLLVIDLQVAAIPLMQRFTKPQDRYTEITSPGNVVISIGESRALLQQLGIAGEIVHTPGHSDDSVSVLLDDGAVFTGDLTEPALIGHEDASVVHASWALLKQRGARRIYPAHGAVRDFPTHS